ncbi:MAG: type II toxin-antitoxin system HicB family antitoxin [Tannerella sp.]|jgi:predicted RNase H-like HicB family nuclease|nr:type II toxin-antitoxin system HicB family antitoxin [Tannerella sp.]
MDFAERENQGSDDQLFKVLLYLCAINILSNKIMEYTAIIEQGKNGWYVAQCAQIPAAISQGKTVSEAEENLKDAIKLLLEYELEETI